MNIYNSVSWQRFCPCSLPHDTCHIPLPLAVAAKDPQSAFKSAKIFFYEYLFAVEIEVMHLLLLLLPTPPSTLPAL